MHELEKHTTIGFVEQLHREHDIKKILETWWVKDKRLFGKNDGVYTMVSLRDPYIYAIELICKLYVEQNYVHFKDAWVPLSYIIITIGSVFSQVSILSHYLNRSIERAQKSI